ncbi:acetyl-CoA hydrolase/transferase family protein [Anaerosphaera multitolerans]|uniref:Acetyl-CoA hydrolase/transferase family protein n=1 Tax=Anaerosphaera multitolerans TaxID=2487351 RepID=A0A437S5F6_9FIRM|nr:acetyl-CoA hydrolase/transferase C-terminal domain-containing protein [Anaerosphaera multitolerans]RVU54251.1 acetyl-CoA hydrolase/transferase family protein [Anaerosphaera multitolerans]
MNWKEEYERKKVSLEEAVKYIKSGDRVVIGHACGEPAKLVEAMVDNKDQYENVEIVHMVAMGKAGYCKEGMEKHFRHNGLFLGGTTKNAVKEGRGDYTPVFFSEIPRLFREKLNVDVALIQLSKPDVNGYMSFGISVDYTKPVCENAKIVIAQVNKNMPRTMGDSFIHISDVDYIVEFDEQIYTLPKPHIGEVEKKIGKNCASLINDGDTLQLGIGAIPDAVLTFLKDKKDLGIHSEMFSDGVVDLIKEGVITNKKKKTHVGKMVVTFLMGTEELYEFVDNNPQIEMRSVDYVNNPVIIMKEDNIVSINSCVQVDLMGQVASESIGSTQISGVGGQVDFVRGSAMAKNGRAIIAMPSTVKGKISKIVPNLDEGAAVTTSRNDVDYIVTEYGIAELKGKNLRERSKALINIAHPDFREELINYHNEKFKENLEI